MLALDLGGGTAILVDEATGEVKWALQAHSLNSWSTEVAMSPDGRFLVSVGTVDGHWKMWDAASGTIHSVGTKHDLSRVCICANDAGGREVQEGCPLEAHTGGLRAVVLLPCGKRFATGGRDGLVLQTGQAKQRMEEEDLYGIFTLCSSSDAALRASLGEKENIYM